MSCFHDKDYTHSMQKVNFISEVSTEENFPYII